MSKHRIPVTAKVVMTLSLIVHSGTDKGDPCGRAVFSALCLLAACALGYSIEAQLREEFKR